MGVSAAPRIMAFQSSPHRETQVITDHTPLEIGSLVFDGLEQFFTSTEVKTMPSFPIHNLESAPKKSISSLQSLQSAFGMIPNMAGAMATSPVLIDSLVGLFRNVHGGSFTEAQIQTLLLTNAVTNGSAWAVALHTGLALQQGLDPADVQAMREGRAPKDKTLAPLSILARTLIEKRGRLDDSDIQQFLTAGYSEELLLEVIAVVAASTMTNYTASVTRPPVDAPFQVHVWKAA